MEDRVVNANQEVFTPLFQLYLKDEAAVRQSSIPLEKIRGPVLLLSGKDDKLWPSAQMADLVMKRLAGHKRPYPDKHLCYKNAGHLLGRCIPGPPVGDSRIRHTVTKVVFDLGGTPDGNAFALWDSWPKVLKFLDENLKLKN
jgi:hypothetical protein